MSNRTILIPLKDGQKAPSQETLDQAKRELEEQAAGLLPTPLWVNFGNTAVMFDMGAQLLGKNAMAGNENLNPPWITLLGFCIELHLKFFIVAPYPELMDVSQLKGLGIRIREHEYPALYDQIDKKYKPRIAASYSRRSDRPVDEDGFRAALENVGLSPFVKWRYIFEHAPPGGVVRQEMNPLFWIADALAEVGREVFKEADKEFTTLRISKEQAQSETP